MLKKTVFAFILLFFVFSAAAEVQYKGEINKESVLMNTSIELSCDSPCPVSRWQLSWNIPEGAEILHVEDSLGEIEDYTVSGNTIQLTTNTGERRRNETVRISMRLNKNAENTYGGLYHRKISLPSFQGEKTTGIFEVDSMVSGWIGYGFEYSFGQDEIRFRGKDPTNIRVNFGEGYETEYYEFFGEKRGNSSQAYEVAVGTTGIVQLFERFPVAVMDNRSYNQKVNRWSSGEYVAGTITLRDDLGRNYQPVLAHETVHGLNDRFLNWDQTSSSYFDEGVGEYVEYLMKRKLYNEGKIGVGPGEVFGEPRKYRTKENGDTYIYTIPSQGSRERLWQYYQENSSFMKGWDPNQYPEAREFGYAYSELLVRNYVRQGGRLRELYTALEGTSRVESREEKWSIFSQHMDMTPCKFESRARFDQCLNSINDYSYPVYTAAGPEMSGSQLQIEKVKVPNRTQDQPSLSIGSVNTTSEKVDFQDFLKGFLDYLASMFSDRLV